MVNRPYVEWMSVEDAKGNAISGNEYLLAEYIDTHEESGNDVLNFCIAVWQDAGDVIEIPKRFNKIKGATAEERVFNSIFGENYHYTVEESGFYHQVFDYQDVDREDFEVFKENKCEYAINRLKDIKFWSGLPLTPEGYITWDEAKVLMDIDTEAYRRKKHDEEIERITDKLQNDSLIRDAFRYLTKKDISKDIEFDYSNTVYGVDFHTNTYDKAKSILSAREFYDVIKYMVDNGITFESIDEIVEKGNENDIYKVLNDIKNKSGVDMTGLFMRRVAHIFFNHRYRDDYYAMRGIYARKYKNRRENIVKILVKTSIERDLLWKVYRIYKILEMGKNSKSDIPEIILTNEFRMMAEQFILYDCVDSVDNVSWVFKVRFGVNEDGTEYDGSETPKLKNKVRASDEDEDGLWNVVVINKDGSESTTKMTTRQLNAINGFDENDEDFENLADYMDVEDDEEDEGVIGVDYPYFAVVLPPNHLMFDAKFVILDNKTGMLVEDKEGNCLLFNDWKKAMEVRAKLEDGVKDK